jgi:pimeloyl-ACP methyl ester carboxylesterase
MTPAQARARARVRIAAALTLGCASAARAEAPRCIETAPNECLQVTAAGQGPEVVLIPGLFGSAFGFRRVIPLLTTIGYRTLVIEPLGVGHSSRPRQADYSLTAQADRIQKVLEITGVRDAVVVAHSIGTSMTLRLASRHPGYVRGVVSLEGGAAEQVATGGFRRAMKLVPLLKLLGAGRVVRGRVRGMLISRSGDPAWVTEEIVTGYTEGASRDMGATLDAFRRMAKAQEPEMLAPRLASITCPVRLVLGAAPHSGGPSDEEIRLLGGSLREFSIERIAGAGHFLFEEAPAAVVSIIDAHARLTHRPRLEGK